MDAIILAAGRNDRLSGVVPAYMKPLLVVNGKTLITHIVHALGLCQRVIVVASPDNVKQLVDVVSPEREDARFIVQPQASGPADALSLGLDLVKSDYTLLACGDNVIPSEHWVNLLQEARPNEWEAIISTRVLPGSDVRRFTYFNHDEVMEKEDPPIPSAPYRAWIGPLIFTTSTLRAMFDCLEPLESLSDVIRSIQPNKRIFVEGHCSDIGVPGELP
jgi:dTDP-glucose pyrophosphorylase